MLITRISDHDHYSPQPVSDTIRQETRSPKGKVMLKRIITCLISLAVSISLYSTPAFAASLPEVKSDKESD